MTITRFDGAFSFLSNFYPSSILREGISYPTVEHAYQAAKTMDLDERRMIALLPTPGAAKKAGRSLSLRPEWDAVKDIVMLDLLRAKFGLAWLAERLLATEGEDLVEGNYWHDQIWGDCNCHVHQSIPGQNLLGKLLMRVRSELTA